MYRRTHYHSTTHEILCVYSGSARLLFGGEKNEGKVEIEVKAGDMVVVPVGVGHRLMEEIQGEEDGEEEGDQIDVRDSDRKCGFMMVGAYPDGCVWDMCFGKEEEGDKTEAVKQVKWLEKDPLYGDDGPVLWGEERLKEHQANREKPK
jgi:uncharacterized protein YjlB